MCGIVGIISSTSSQTNQDRLTQMRDSLSHRGPDDQGSWISSDGRVALGHRRLSILDLTEAGHQPMTAAEGALSIVFNGEIYNYLELKRQLEASGHRFQTHSDTEVILESYREWGPDCISKLNGMFAFALYDRQRNSVLLARDRVGEKPLFYLLADGKLAFASELKALMADPDLKPTLELRSLEYYFAYGYVPGNRCLLKGVQKLPPAHALSFDVNSGQSKIWRYWALPMPDLRESSDEELLVELEQLLEDSVRKQLVADVPVGILLSGGIDSSLVTALAARVSSRRVKTFTISFPGYGTYDEGPYAKIVASAFGTEHCELAAEPASVQLLPELARQFDEPMCDSSMIPTYLVSKLIRRQATVALGGDGGDELFGGYRHYGWLMRQDRWKNRLPGPLRTLIRAVASKAMPVGMRGRNYLLGMANGSEQRLSHVNLFFDRESRRQLVVPLRTLSPDVDLPEAYKDSLAERERGMPGLAMAADFRSYLPEDILVKVDRASMLVSLEVRAPWLDYRIVEFAFRRVPNRMKATTKKRKILPTMLARKLLPPELDLDRKQGFSIPLKQWLKGEWGEFVSNVLMEADQTLFDRRVIAQLLERQRLGFVNSERLFGLTLFELWRRHYKVACS
jgi:asparagine synthase (glutamine-hydrolysing)